MHPVTRQIIIEGARPSAVDAFTAFYRLEELRRAAEHSFRSVDALALPTAPALYTVEQVLADPILLNSRLGAYTNFVNLLDLCGIAVPAERCSEGRPFGITLLGPAGQDAFLASIARRFHRETGLTLGALEDAQPPLAPLPPVLKSGETPLAIVAGAASAGALLRRHGARFLERMVAAPAYRLSADVAGDGLGPSLLPVEHGTGAPIELEIWALQAPAFGHVAAGLPAGLMLAKVQLADGRLVNGFVLGSSVAALPAAVGAA